MQETPEFFETAICADVETGLMYPDETDPMQVAIAKSVCLPCPAAEDCLRWALDNREMLGVYGATTGDERRRMLNKITREHRRLRSVD